MLIAFVSVVGFLFCSSTYAQNTTDKNQQQYSQQNQQQEKNTDKYWISATGQCIYWVWKWCFDYEKMMFSWSNLDNVNKHKTVLTVLQDVVLWATFMIWTVLMIVIIYCGFMYILAAWSGKDPKSYKDWLVRAAIWALLVRWAYAIVRLIQYIARW